MLSITLAALFGALVPWMVFSEMDKKAENGRYTLNRLAFVVWFFGSFLLAIVGGALGSFVDGAGGQAAGVGWAIALMPIASRRLHDVGASPWLALLGLLWPLALLGHLALMIIPGNTPSMVAEAKSPQQRASKPKASLIDSDTDFLSVPETPPQAQELVEELVEETALPTTEPLQLSTLSITLSQNGSTYGPYALPELLALWDEGQIAGNAQYWCEDFANWKTLAGDIESLRAINSWCARI